MYQKLIDLYRAVGTYLDALNEEKDEALATVITAYDAIGGNPGSGGGSDIPSHSDPLD